MEYNYKRKGQMIMPVLILLGLGAIFGGIALKDSLTTNKKAFTKEESDEMLSQMIGKSKKECRKILRQHRK